MRTPTIGFSPTTSLARRIAGSIVPGAFALGAVATGAALLPGTGAHAAANTNSVAYWCGSSDNGVKYEPVSDPFMVPDAPGGFEWSIAVVKAGSGPDENFVVQNPSAGDALSYPGDNPANSHVILCWTPVEEPPADEPPADEPPADEAPPPADPPADEPPAEEPPVETTVPTVAQTTPPLIQAPPEEVASLAGVPEVPQAAPQQPVQQLPSTGANGVALAAMGTAFVLGGVALRRLARRAA